MAGYRKRGKVWYYRITGANGNKVERAGCSDKRATEEMARAAETAVARQRAGLDDPKAERMATAERTPLIDHLASWRKHLIAKGGTVTHADLLSSRARRAVGIILGADLDAIDPPKTATREQRAEADKSLDRILRSGRLSRFTPTRVQSALADLIDAGRSRQTANHYRAALRNFARWLVAEGLTRDVFTTGTTGYDVEEDRRHDRGVLSADEFGKLLESADPGEPFRDLAGKDRAMLYLVASDTGLRASELASLIPASFDLEGLTVRLEAAEAKNGREALLPIRADLADLLKSYLDGRPADAPVWPGTWPKRAADMLRIDLERSGVAYLDGDGRYRDFHSLRHRFGTALALANVPPKVIQSLMRHSTITLTMDRYANHIGISDTAAAPG
jgi:integrase